MELQPKPLETAGGGARPDLTPPPETTRVEAERPSAGGPSALFWVTAVSAGVSLAVGIVGVVSAVTSEEKEPGTIVAAVGGGLGIALSVTSIVLLVTGEDPPPPALTPPSSPLELRWGAGHPGGP